MASPIEFDRDVPRHFSNCLVHFVRGVGRSVRVDVNAAALTPHVFIRLQSPNALFKVVTRSQGIEI